VRLATLRTATGSVAVRVEEDELVELPYPDVVALLSDAHWPVAARLDGGRRHPASGADFDSPVRPAKVVCVGLNYRSHIEEMGRPLPKYVTLFAKFTDTLAGPYDDLVVPAAASEVDWEAELGVVIGRPVRNVTESEAAACIAGYTVLNDVSMRDWQWRTTQWMAGKNFEASTPVGPVVVTGDEVGEAADLELRCDVDGVTVQKARTSDLLFPPAAVVAYVSRFTTLRPGDLMPPALPAAWAPGATRRCSFCAASSWRPHWRGSARAAT
jgi:acylpyruvate hydrolase